MNTGGGLVGIETGSFLPALVLFRRCRNASIPPLGARLVAGPLLVKNRSQAAALDELHGVVVDALVATDAKNRHDVRMLELGGGLGLDLEPLPMFGIDRRGKRQYLQGDPPAERNLLGLVHNAHSPPADLPENPVIAEPRAGGIALARHPFRPRHPGVKLDGRSLNALQAGETLAQRVGDPGVLGQELFAHQGRPDRSASR